MNSNRREAELLKELGELKEDLSESQRVSKIGSLRVNYTTGRRSFSDEYCHLFGLPHGEGDCFHTVDKHYDFFLAMVHPEDLGLVKKVVNRMREGHPSYDTQYRIIRPTGEVRVVRSRAEVGFDKNGKLARMIGTLQDITELKKYQEELSRMARAKKLTELTTLLANQLNTPLTEILDNAKQLQDAIHAAIMSDEKAREAHDERENIQQRLDNLTKREADVFRLVVDGFLNKQTAFELGISEKTVNVHRARVMKKMGADSLAELVRMDHKVA